MVQDPVPVVPLLQDPLTVAFWTDPSVPVCIVMRTLAFQRLRVPEVLALVRSPTCIGVVDFKVNVAVQVLSASMTTDVGVLVPPQFPLQPLNELPVAALAVRVTEVLAS